MQQNASFQSRVYYFVIYTEQLEKVYNESLFYTQFAYMNTARCLTLNNRNISMKMFAYIILNAFPLIKNFFLNANALRITATNIQKSYYIILIKLVLLINLARRYGSF